MATSSTSLGTWVSEKNAFAAYNGLHRNRTWEAWIISNQSADQKNVPLLFIGLRAYIIFTRFSQIENILSSDRVSTYGYFPDFRGPYFYVALFLVIVNSIKPILAQAEEKNRSNQNKNNALLKQPEPTAIDQFLVGVSQATPYLMIITNIVVDIIQVHRGESSSLITLAFTGVTLIDITKWKPKNYEWFRDTVLDYPVSATAFYYANNKGRIGIIGSLALKTETVKKMIQNPAQAKQMMMQALQKRLGI